MSKRDDAIAKGIAAMAQAENDALGGAFDDGVANGTSDDGISQQTVDDAVAAALAQAKIDSDAAVAAAQAVDAQALADAKTASDAAMADLQSKFDALKGEEDLDKKMVSDMQNSLVANKAAFDQIFALIPAPAPAPDAPAS